MNSVTFPWPPRECSPNWRGHWSTRAKAAKQYKHACFVLAKEAKLALPDGYDGPLHLWMTFHKPSRRQMDDDNLVAMFKPGRDGLALALGVDDKRFVCHPHIADTIAGMVKVTISMGPE